MFNFTHQLEALKSSIIAIVLILACTILGLIWISIALYSLLVIVAGPLWGPLVLGLVFLLPIAVYAIIKALPANQKKKKQSAFEAAFANSTVGSISLLIESLSGTSPILATVAAVIAGFMATRFPQFLPLLSQLVTAVAQEMQLRSTRKAEANKTKTKAEADRGAAAPPPPDVEPATRRRGKKTADMY